MASGADVLTPPEASKVNFLPTESVLLLVSISTSERPQSALRASPLNP